MTDFRTQTYIDGLLQERAMYDKRGLTKRVADVDAELKRVGYTRATKPASKERAVKTKVETRGK